MKRQKPQSHPAIDPSIVLREAAAQLEHAEASRLKRDFDRAESICNGLLRQHPTYFAALYTLGLVLADKKDYGRALLYLMRALIRSPRSILALNALSGVLIELNANELASEILEIALRISPNDPVFLTTLGELFREQRRYEQAIQTFDRALGAERNLTEASLGLALSLQATGRLHEAAQTLEELVRKRQSSIDTLFSLAQLPKAFVSIDLLDAANQQNRNDYEDPNNFRNVRNFIKAIALDRLGRYEEAWKTMLEANQECRRSVLNEYQSLQRQQSQTKQWLKSNLKPNQNVSREDFATSLFILGPSRSGKTSLEAMLSSHESVNRGYETECVEQSTRSAFQSNGLIDSFPLINLPSSCYQAFRDAYCSRLTLPSSAAYVFTNTNPSNIHNIGPLFSIIPNVRVAFIKRNLEDVTLRIFMYRYKAGNSYAYDLKSIREHVLWYYEIMDMIADRYPEIVTIVNYEDLVEDPHKVVRSICNLCKLDASTDLKYLPGDDRDCAVPYSQWMLNELTDVGV